MIKKIALIATLGFSNFSLNANDMEYPKLQIFKKMHFSDTDLFLEDTRLTGFTTDFKITRPSHLTVLGHINMQHRGIPLQGRHMGQDYESFRQYAVGYGLKLTLTYAEIKEQLGSDNGGIELGKSASFGRKLILGSTTGDNINGSLAHYSQGSIEGYEKLMKPGYYRLEVWGNSHTDFGGMIRGGLIEVAPTWNNQITYNQIIVRVEDQ